MTEACMHEWNRRAAGAPDQDPPNKQGQVKPTPPRLFYARRQWEIAQSRAVEAWQQYYADGSTLADLDRATAAQSRAVQAEGVYRELKAKYD